MGKQLNFFLTPADFRAVENQIRRSGDVMFLPGTVDRPELEELATMAIGDSEMGQVMLRAYVTRSDFASSIRFHEVPEQGYCIITPGSPVIEVDRCFFDGRVLRRGRLYFLTAPAVDNSFRNWADSVCGPSAAC